jgi:hypothetical protein
VEQPVQPVQCHGDALNKALLLADIWLTLLAQFAPCRRLTACLREDAFLSLADIRSRREDISVSAADTGRHARYADDATLRMLTWAMIDSNSRTAHADACASARATNPA